jgi:monoamine oxidase
VRLETSKSDDAIIRFCFVANLSFISVLAKYLRIFGYKNQHFINMFETHSKRWMPCAKMATEWQTDNPFSGEVIIVGAGLAGLYAAEMLIQQGISVKVLEATDGWGGRLRSLPLASEAARMAQNRVIQGQFSVLHDLLQQTETPLTPYTENNLYYFNGALNTEAEANQNTFFQEMLQAVESLNTFNGADITVEEYFNALGISSNLTAVSNVLTAQPLGTSYDRASALGIAKQYEQWSAGMTKYVVSNSNLEQALEQAFAGALSTVQYATPIGSIDYTGNRIILTDQLGGNHACDRVLITIPLHALQAGACTRADRPLQWRGEIRCRRPMRRISLPGRAGLRAS